MKVVSQPYPDPSQFDPQSPYFDPKSQPENPRWQLVDMQFVEKFDKPIALSRLRQETSKICAYCKSRRLSILPLTPQEWQIICDLAKQPTKKKAT